MHPALLAVVPSVSEQSGPVAPVAQRQVSVEEHLVVEAVLVLKMSALLSYFQHPGGTSDHEPTNALVSL